MRYPGAVLRKLVVLALVAVAVPAHAQSVEAESLFRDGKLLLKEGKISAACDKFEASERLDPGVGTELNLADCREQNVQLATAWAMYRKAAANAKHAGNDAKREALARNRATALEPRLSYLQIIVTEDVRVDGLTITRDGAEVDDVLWNQRVAIDQGEYTIEAKAPKRVPWRSRVVIREEGVKKSVEVPELEKKGKKPAVEEAEAEREPKAEPAAHDEPERAPSKWTGRRKLAIASGVLAIAGAAAGGALGAHAFSLEDESDKLCPKIACTDMKGLSLNSDARAFALYADISYGVAGVAAVGAVVLWLTGAPREHDVAIGASRNSIFVVGRF
jgi:hypothetical protein